MFIFLKPGRDKPDARKTYYGSCDNFLESKSGGRKMRFNLVDSERSAKIKVIGIGGARGMLMNITCGSDLTMVEMTEASDRIYKEAGEDAEIIWGTVLDDSIGDELRVTVIATGIEEKRESKLRGRLRPVTPQDVERAVNYDEPTFIRYKKAVGNNTESDYRVPDGLIIDNNDLEVPTFMRRRAN